MADQDKKGKKPTVTKYRPGSSLADERERVLFEGHDLTEEYVNVFEKCRSPEELYHLIDLVLKGKIYPYAEGKLPFRYPSQAKLPDETYTVGNVVCGHWEGVPGKRFLYADARACAVRLRRSQPSLPRLPSVCGNIQEGLRDIQDWCIERKAKGGRKKKYTSEKIANMRTTFDKHCGEGKGQAYAWNCVAEEHGIKTGKAAQMAVRRNQPDNK